MTRLEQGHANRSQTGSDDENGETISLFYVLFLMLDRMIDSYSEWIHQLRLVIPNHLLRHTRRTCKGFVTGGRRKIPV